MTDKRPCGLGDQFRRLVLRGDRDGGAHCHPHSGCQTIRLLLRVYDSNSVAFIQTLFEGNMNITINKVQVAFGFSLLSFAPIILEIRGKSRTYFFFLARVSRSLWERLAATSSDRLPGRLLSLHPIVDGYFRPHVIIGSIGIRLPAFSSIGFLIVLRLLNACVVMPLLVLRKRRLSPPVFGVPVRRLG